MIERTFAEALGAGVGDRVTLNGRPFTVAGIAVTQPDARALAAAARAPLSYFLNLRLKDPSRAQAFAGAFDDANQAQSAPLTNPGANAARRPRRRAALIAISARLPVPLLLGLRLIVRRPRRAVLSAASIAVTVTGIGALLGVPLGIALFAAANGAGLVTIPPLWWLAAVVAGRRGAGDAGRAGRADLHPGPDRLPPPGGRDPAGRDRLIRC